ncbi:MAG: type II toxin-antitoxin system VapC family toxin [Anaerolineae bacterium]|nr:type II toxin-antitoxin system VapC family toxin [Anaerolineae bacterium]
MGKLAEHLTGHICIGLDTCVLIYHIERHPVYFAVTQPLLADIESGHFAAIASILTLMEITVHPWQLQRSDIVQDYEEILIHFPNLTLVDVTRDIAGQAACLRAQYHLRPADALHVATALVHGVTAFVTNDRQLMQLREKVQVILLEDCVPV